MEEQKNEYVLSLFEACETLNKSSRTVSRYVRKGILHPMAIKSRQGTLEYRFSKVEIDAFKCQEDQIRQVTYLPQDMPPAATVARFTSVNFQEPPAIVDFPPVVEVTPDKTDQNDMEEPKEIKREETKEIKDQAGGTTVEMPQTQFEQKLVPSQDKEIITLLKETTEILRDQLQVKDEQIKSLNGKIDNLIERDRETNILLKGMQDKMVLLGKPKGQQEQQEPKEQQEQRGRAEEAPSASIKYVKEEKPKIKNNHDRQDKSEKPEKIEKLKKNETPKQKKGFWGGLFGK